MKKIHHSFFAIPVLLFMVAWPIRASLYVTSDPTFGPNSITVDTSTGLGWLNLSEAAGLSYEQVSSEMQAGGTFSGFRYATVQEVLGLYSSAGIPGTGVYSFSTPAIPSLFSLIGTSGTINGYPGMIAISGTPRGDDGPLLYCAPAIYAFGYNGVEEYVVNDGGFKAGGTAYGPTASYPDLSSWLVEEVPEPASPRLLVFVVVSWCGFKFLRPRRAAARC